MDDGSWLQLAVFIIMVVLGAYFAGCESAYSALNKIRLKTRAEDGDVKAKKALYISNNFDKAITTLLIGNNITHIAAASVATAFVAGIWDINDPKVSVLCTVISTAIVFLFSEMIPKAFANDRCDSMSMACAGSLRFLMKVLSPLVAFFSLISNSVSKLFKTEEAPSITEEELYDIIDTIEEEGVMDEEQSDLFKSALEFSGTTAADVMTMRSDICAIDISMSNEEIVKEIIKDNHSRLPVYDGSLDNILGVLQIRSFLKEYRKDPHVELRAMLTETFFVSDNANIDDLLSVMRKKKNYLAVVTDEADNTVGIVTIEDFLEELVGEIWDEDDVVDQDFFKMGGNRFTVNTHLTVGDAFARMGIECDDATLADTPIIAWVLKELGHFPEEGESFNYGSLEVTIEEVEEGKLENVIIKLDADLPTTPETDTAAAESEKEVK